MLSPDDVEYDDGWPRTDTPLLILHGELDPATPFFRAQQVGAYYDAPNQHFVSFPHGAHGVTQGTPLPSDPDNDHCAMQLYLAFPQDPYAPLDLSCVNEVLPIDFEGTPELASAFLGTGDFWALDVPAPPLTPPPTPPPLEAPTPSRLSRAIQQILRQIQLHRALNLLNGR